MTKILAIETSCDETAAAIIENGRKILSNVVATQVDFHRKYGGIVPEIASRKHIELINSIIQEALDRAKLTFKKIDAVAVTYGPGLVGSLLVGVCAAKALAFALKKPFIGVNHLEGHIYANFLNSPPYPPSLNKRGGNKRGVSFPFVCLIVSGGHTSLVYAKKYGQYETLGRTRDDAAGEAFDKVARFLDLGYPGGPIIDKLSKKGNPHAIEFKRPMMEKEFGFDFSFSGIKTAVVYYVKKMREEPTLSVSGGIRIEDLVASFQAAVVDVLVEKTIRAAQEKKVKTICLAGGVSANSLLRDEMLKRGKGEGFEVIIPPLELTTDNAAMIGCTAYYKLKHKEVADFTLKPVASLPL